MFLPEHLFPTARKAVGLFIYSHGGRSYGNRNLGGSGLPDAAVRGARGRKTPRSTKEKTIVLCSVGRDMPVKPQGWHGLFDRNLRSADSAEDNGFPFPF